MQNFTLGKKGMSMLLFAFILLIGNLPSFGQTCPTTDGTESDQTFCYLQTIGDIVTDGDAIYQTAGENDTQPIPQSELLTDGVTYFAGSSAGGCVRRPITVSVTNAPRPANIITNSIVSGFEFTTCTPATFNSDDLADLFVPLSDEYRIEVYASEESTVALENEPLNAGSSYFVGQVPNNPGNTNGPSCPSFRVAVGFNPNQIEAPNTEAVQQFCENATVADLVAEGTYNNTQAIRWYRSQTANSPLSNDTQLINGESYFAAQVVNERGSPLPPCETQPTDRAEVSVQIQQPIDLGTPEAGIVCETDVSETFPSIDAIRNYYLALLPEGTPTDGTFDPTPAAIAEMYQDDLENEDGLGDFTTVYTVGIGECESSVELTATIVPLEEANPGSIEGQTVACNENELINLADLPNDGGMSGGTFTGEGVDENGNFDPAVGPGVYTITYTVDDSSFCVIEGSTNFTTFTITVEGIVEIPETIVMEMCITEVQALFENPLQAEAFFNTILEENGITNFDGTFDPSENVVGPEIFAYINSEPTAPETFNTTYTITSDCGEESVSIALTINNTEAPTAGPINPAPVCSTATPFNLFSLLGAENDMGGTFTDENGVIEDGLFDVSEMGSFPITYTVTESIENCTSGEPDATTFNLVVSEGTVAESPAPVMVCSADVDALFPSFDEIRKFYTAIAQQAGFPTNGTFDPIPREISSMYQADQDGLGPFTTTYTFGEGECQTSVDLTVIIVEDADAGENGSVTLTTEDDAVNLFDYLEGTPMEGGTWSNGDGMFDPATDEEGVFTYTVTLGSCIVSATVTVTVEDETDPTDPTDPEIGCAGPDVDLVICEAQVAFYIANPGEAAEFFAGIIAPTVDQSGTFTPSLESIAAQWLNNPVGTFTSTYTVNNDDCEDSAVITIEVTEGDEIVRDPVTNIVCESDVQALFPSNDEIRKYYLALVPAGISRTGGTFSPNAARIAALYQADEDGLGEFSTTYTVQDGECSVSVFITVNIVAEEEASTGEIAGVEVCNDEETINLFDLLDSEDNTLGGTFSNDNGVIVNGILDVTVPGEYEITYTVSGEDATTCLTGTAFTTFMVNSIEGDANAGPGATLQYCITEIEAMTPQEALAIFNNLLPEDVDQDGEFSPSIADLIADFMENPIGTFATEYTVGEGPCQATAEYVVIINDTEVANAGPATTVTLCSSEGEINLTDYLNSEANPNGTFEGLEGNLFNPSEAGIDTYTFTYTVNSSTACVTGEDSVIYTVEVIAGANAGVDNSRDICLAEVDNFSQAQVRSLYLNLLESGVSRNGTFSPTIAEIITQYNQVSKLGDFTTNYTVTEGDCSATVELTVTVLATPDAPVAQAEQFFCSASNATVGDLTVTGENAVWFEDEALTTQADETDALVDGQVYYAVATSENGCSSSATSVTVTIDDSVDAPVADAEQTFCSENNPTVADLDITGNNIVVYEDEDLTVEANETDPLTDGGIYYVTTACAADATMITVSVIDTPETPVADAQQSFCIVDSPTVGDIVITGDNIVWYSDAELTIVLPETTELVNDVTYYANSSVGEGACESSTSVMVTVTLNTAVSPTIQPEGNEFCRSDNPTVQDLIENLNGDGIRIYTTSTGGTPVANTTALQNGMTYYATATNATTGCESDERRAVNVEVGFCGIPEGFSPNGDNINDRFVIPDIAEDYPNYTIEIFNRWGNAVFKGNASTPDWDGVSNQSTTLGDNVLPAGVYFYILNYNDGQTTPVQGKLYLSR